VANATNSQDTQGGAHGDGAAAHAHGVGRYFGVWAVLICGTILTVITGRIDLGAGNILLALTIASIKATLVILFFMHMTEAPAANRIVFVVSVVFAIVLIVGVFGDLWTRNGMTLPSAAPSTEGPEIEAPAAAAPLAPAPPGR
jgi:cytochrome c oxidase subunit 4